MVEERRACLVHKPFRAATSLVSARESFDAQRSLLVSFVDAMAQAASSEELRKQMAPLYRCGRRAVADILRASLGEEAGRLQADPEAAASFLIAVIDGLVLQWLLDPDETPSGQQLVTAVADAIGLALNHGAAPGPNAASWK